MVGSRALMKGVIRKNTVFLGGSSKILSRAFCASSPNFVAAMTMILSSRSAT